MKKKRNLPELMSLEQAANYLGLPKDLLMRQAARGKIPGRRVGRAWRFLKSELAKFKRCARQGLSLDEVIANARRGNECAIELLSLFREFVERERVTRAMDEGCAPFSRN